MYIYNITVRVLDFLVAQLKKAATKEVEVLLAKQEQAAKLALECEAHSKNSQKVNALANKINLLTGE